MPRRIACKSLTRRPENRVSIETPWGLAQIRTRKDQDTLEPSSDLNEEMAGDCAGEPSKVGLKALR
jgi:hypothetical protein